MTPLGTEPVIVSQEALERRWLVSDAVASIVWFAMDGCWMAGFHRAAMTLIVPAVLAHLIGIVLLVRRRDTAELLVGFGVFTWLLMNVFWMDSDIRHHATSLLWAKLSFAAGAAFIALAAALHAPAMLKFRRLRIGAREPNPAMGESDSGGR